MRRPINKTLQSSTRRRSYWRIASPLVSSTVPEPKPRLPDPCMVHKSPNVKVTLAPSEQWPRRRLPAARASIIEERSRMAQRGVLYMVWGAKAGSVLGRSIESVRRHLPDLPIHVLELPADTDPVQGLLQKARMAELTPFETTLFLDADTVVLGDLGYGFTQAERYGLACTICECPWARRYRGL